MVVRFSTEYRCGEQISRTSSFQRFEFHTIRKKFFSGRFDVPKEQGIKYELKQIANQIVSTRILCLFSELDANPGPSYNPTDARVYRFQHDPKFTIASRTKSLALFQTPGPNTKPTDLDVYKLRSPRYPIFQRTKELKSDRIPGPNAYDAAEGKGKVMKHNPAYSMRSKTSDLTKDKRPGPADYDLKTHIPFDKTPAYSLRRRHSEYVHVPIVPMDNC